MFTIARTNESVPAPNVACLVVLFAGILAAIPVTGQVTIDDFQDSQAWNASTPSSTASQSAGTIAGFFRDGLLESKGGGAVGTLGGGELRFQRLTAEDVGNLRIDWDGKNDVALFDPAGIPAMDLTTGALNALRFEILANATSLSVRVVVWSSAKQAEYVDVVASGTGEQLLPFEVFTPLPPYRPVDFGSITAVQLITDTYGATDWTIGPITTGLHTLPIELVSFDAISDGRGAHLRWRSASEANSTGFVVQQEDATGNWNEIGFVVAHGNPHVGSSYEYYVAELGPGAYRFRLKQMGMDGSFAYSYVVETSVAHADFVANLEAYPNPFGSTVTVTFEIDRESDVQLAVYDLLGREVRVLQRGYLPAARHQVNFDAEGLPGGVYVALLTTGTSVSTTMLTCVR